MSRSRVSDRDDWYEVWMDDKEAMLNTMVKNMVADLNAGYQYFGNVIVNQRREIEAYQQDIRDKLDLFATMDDKQVNRWCFYDLVKRGAII